MGALCCPDKLMTMMMTILAMLAIMKTIAEMIRTMMMTMMAIIKTIVEMIRIMMMAMMMAMMMIIFAIMMLIMALMKTRKINCSLGDPSDDEDDNVGKKTNFTGSMKVNLNLGSQDQDDPEGPLA